MYSDTDMIPDFLRGPFGFEARGSTQISMVSLTMDELYAGLYRTPFFRGLMPDSRTSFASHFDANMRLSTLGNRQVRLSKEHYTHNVGRALSYLFHDHLKQPYNVEHGAETLVRSCIAQLSGLSDEQANQSARQFKKWTHATHREAAPAKAL